MTSLTKRKARMDMAADADARRNAGWARQHLANLPRERREQLEREWEEAAVDIRENPNSAEIKARADEEWRSCA